MTNAKDVRAGIKGEGNGGCVQGVMQCDGTTNSNIYNTADNGIWRTGGNGLAITYTMMRSRRIRMNYH